MITVNFMIFEHRHTQIKFLPPAGISHIFISARVSEEKFATIASYMQSPTHSTTELLQEFESHFEEPAADITACLKAAGLQNIKKAVMPPDVAFSK